MRTELNKITRVWYNTKFILLIMQWYHTGERFKLNFIFFCLFGFGIGLMGDHVEWFASQCGGQTQISMILLASGQVWQRC